VVSFTLQLPYHKPRYQWTRMWFSIITLRVRCRLNRASDGEIIWRPGLKIMQVGDRLCAHRVASTTYNVFWSLGYTTWH